MTKLIQEVFLVSPVHCEPPTQAVSNIKPVSPAIHCTGSSQSLCASWQDDAPFTRHELRGVIPLWPCTLAHLDIELRRGFRPQAKKRTQYHDTHQARDLVVPGGSVVSRGACARARAKYLRFERICELRTLKDVRSEDGNL